MPREYLDHPVSGYRAFRLVMAGRQWDINGHVVAKDPYLSAINVSFGPWFPGINEAEHCGKGVHKGQRLSGMHQGPCPAPGDACGFWTVHSLLAALAKLNWPEATYLVGDAEQLPYVPVVGVIQGWGRVQEHGDGYRLQYATVIALALYPSSDRVTAVYYDFAEETLKRICRQFDVPFVRTNAELEYLKERLDAQTQDDKEPA